MQPFERGRQEQCVKKNEVSCKYFAQNVHGRKIVGRKM